MREESLVSEYTTSFGPVRIIPAHAIRRDPQYLHAYSQGPHTSNAVPHTSEAPYYMGFGHEPYGEHAFVEQFTDQSPYGQHFSYPATAFYPGYSYTPYTPGAYGAYPSQSTAYRPFPQPSPPHRRSRTAPARTLNRPGAPPPPTMQRSKSRGISADPLERSRYTAYSGPFKRPQPLYRKRRDFRTGMGFQETDFGGGPVDYSMTFARSYPSYLEQPGPSVRRIRPYYAPSYTTYPPSTMHRASKRKHRPEKYPILFRAVLKAAQLIIGAAILGLVLGPMRNASFHDFVIRTKTEWQGAVVGITSFFSIFSLILLATCCLARRVHAWRKLDAVVSITGAFCYLVAAFIEAYFAACYPPNGPKIGLVCHRAEWIIATVLLFINVVAYLIDLWLTWSAGVTIL